jgi:putative ABC transport system substrate-binding protein
MKRRKFVTLLGGAVTAWPLAARAQQPAMPVIGFLNGGSPGPYAQFATAFRHGLSDTGYVEGRNVAIEYRWAEGHYDRLREMAADLIGRQVAVIVCNTAAAHAAKALTTTIPIVFSTGGDPIHFGLVTSLSRPGGNVTGVANLNVELGPKWLELLRELVPTATAVALLVNPTNPNSEPLSRNLQAAARALKLGLHVLNASTDRDFDTVFDTLGQLRAGGLVIGPDALYNSRNQQLAALTLRHAVPAISVPDFAVAGGLMGYGGSITDAYRRVGVYTGRILNGEKPADLPVQQSTKVELIINFRTAKTLGLDVPPTLLARADEVIE